MLKYAYSCTKALLVSAHLSRLIGGLDIESEKLILFRVLAGVLFPMRAFCMLLDVVGVRAGTGVS
jgi:hypothetical protein